MSELPVDIWWIILKKLWNSDPFTIIDPGKYKNYENPMRSFLDYYKKFGEGTSNDLYLVRTLCKTTKKMVDKYSNRYIYGWESGKVPRYYLIFPYEK